MTHFHTQKSTKVLIPTGFYKSSPLITVDSGSLETLRNSLDLQWWSEVETRFVDIHGKPVYYIGKKKTNIVVANYITQTYPKAHISFESSANMIEFDTGLCSSYHELITQLSTIQSIKEDVLKQFGLYEGKARVEESELSEPFVNPIDDSILELIRSYGLDEARKKVSAWSISQKQESWLNFTPRKRIEYILDIQTQIEGKILNFTKTTSQQLTLSSKNHEITLRLHAQLLNTIYEYYHTYKNFDPRTKKRWKQWKKIVNYRAEHGIGVKNWYEPKFPGSDYRKYFKKNYFENNIKDNYSIGDLEKFVMSHGPQSKKFSLDTIGNPIPRTEFRLQDSMDNVLDAHRSIEYIFELLLASPHKNNPVYIYEYSTSPYKKTKL